MVTQEQTTLSRVWETARNFVGERLYKTAEAATLGMAALAINHTDLDAMSGGHAADIVGTTAAISFVYALSSKDTPPAWPVAIGLGSNVAKEFGQRYGWFADMPHFNNFDGVYDPKDFAAFAAGALLYIGIGKARSLIQSRRSRSMGDPST